MLVQYSMSTFKENVKTRTTTPMKRLPIFRHQPAPESYWRISWLPVKKFQNKRGTFFLKHLMTATLYLAIHCKLNRISKTDIVHF